MINPDNIMVLMMKTPEVVIVIKVMLMSTMHKDNQVLNVVVKDAQDG